MASAKIIYQFSEFSEFLLIILPYHFYHFIIFAVLVRCEWPSFITKKTNNIRLFARLFLIKEKDDEIIICFSE